MEQIELLHQKVQWAGCWQQSCSRPLGGWFWHGSLHCEPCKIKTSLFLSGWKSSWSWEIWSTDFMVEASFHGCNTTGQRCVRYAARAQKLEHSPVSSPEPVQVKVLVNWKAESHEIYTRFIIPGTTTSFWQHTSHVHTRPLSVCSKGLADASRKGDPTVMLSAMQLPKSSPSENPMLHQDQQRFDRRLTHFNLLIMPSFKERKVKNGVRCCTANGGAGLHMHCFCVLVGCWIWERQCWSQQQAILVSSIKQRRLSASSRMAKPAAHWKPGHMQVSKSPCTVGQSRT